MVTRAAIDEFMSGKTVALLGASRNPKRFAAAVHRELVKKGWRVHPVNPQAERIGDEPCYASPADLPGPVDGAIVLLNRARTPDAVRACVDAGVPRIWIQPESRSKEGVAIAEAAGVPVIHGECIMMYLEPAAFIHRLHRGIRRLLGRMPG